MDNLEHILILLFRRVSARMVYEENVDAVKFRRDTFLSVAYTCMPQYSESELDNMWSYYRDILEKKRVDIKGGGALRSEGIRVFDALFYYADSMLTMQDSEPVCRYERLLQWRRTTFELSEDLLTAAYFTGTQQPVEMEKRGYAWKIITGHNNYQLNAIMDRGISENHFHLYGSAPIFHISWISLMNNVQNDSIMQNLGRYDHDRRNGNTWRNTSYREDALQIQVYQAAWIRLFFYAYFTGTKIEIQWKRSGERRQPESQNAVQNTGQGENHYNEDDCGEMRPETKKDNWQKELLEDILWMFHEEYRLQENVSELQGIIETLRAPSFYAGDKGYEDYALTGVRGTEGEIDLFSGERWLLYSCMYEIRKERFGGLYTNLFYMYLLIRENIRAELVQTNEGVGFRNFQIYEKRKFQLTASSAYKNDFVRAAVRENLISPHLLSLEIRISPGNSVIENVQYIRELDRVIGEPGSRYYYVMHFIKRPDEEIAADDRVRFRHYSLRGKIRRQADAIIGMRENYPECAARLLGIDAASIEIGCRPEVFACEFRRLRNHTKKLNPGEFVHRDEMLDIKCQINDCGGDEGYGDDRSQSIRMNEIPWQSQEAPIKLPQLRATCHVGEDFLDIADGLRAIDEAINFLNLDCGDRLGHALALGQDVDDWYRSKNYRILLPQQDYLDNIVWIYNRLIDFKISGFDVLKDYIERKYVYYFDVIYGKYLDYGMIDRVLADARRIYQKEGFPNVFHNDRYQFGIHQYSNAWKLRGDDPELYAHGYFDYFDDGTLEQKSLVNPKFPKEFGIRRRPEIFLLNYYYQYDPDVRREGSRRIEVRLRPDYVEAVKYIQREMQRLVGRKGILIEANPSSNYKIGTFRDYAKHPIFRLYNSGLTYDAEKLAECPQLSVSVNTDDKGVFSTSLENEYALLAKALEDQTDVDGKPIYTKAMICDWIDAVRKMGNEQSFHRSARKT